MAKIIKLYEKGTNSALLNECVEILNKGGIIIYPTDTVYAMGVSLLNNKGIDKLRQIKGLKRGEDKFSLICGSIAQATPYVAQYSQPTFKLLKRNLPGPFTFILSTHRQFPRKIQLKRKTIGIRVPDNDITRAIVERLGNPLLTTSIKDEDKIIEYTVDPELIYEKWNNRVDLVIDGGFGQNEASTIVDLSDEEPEIIRQGLGELQF